MNFMLLEIILYLLPHLQIVLDKRHANDKSPNMEKLAFTMILQQLLDQGVDIVEVVTDQHPQIIAYMSKL